MVFSTRNDPNQKDIEATEDGGASTPRDYSDDAQNNPALYPSGYPEEKKVRIRLRSDVALGGGRDGAVGDEVEVSESLARQLVAATQAEWVNWEDGEHKGPLNPFSDRAHERDEAEKEGVRKPVPVRDTFPEIDENDSETRPGNGRRKKKD